MRNTDLIDWEKQWEGFAENFHDGYAHIHLKKYGAKKNLSFRLAPGPGFGDLSHPTTALALELMIKHMSTKDVLDIGCGSGILSLASALLGSRKVTGVDISKEAVSHAKKNAKINDFQHLARFFFCFPPEPVSSGGLILMNMIFSEQKEVMKEKEKFQSSGCLWITSGILEEQKESYLAQALSWGWKLIEYRVKDSWVGFVFENSAPFQKFLE